MKSIPNIKLNSGNYIPTIGNGPGIIGYSAKAKKAHKNKLTSLTNKVYNKFIGRPKLLRDYVESVTNSFNTGFTLLDNSAAYNNNVQIAQAIKKSSLERKDIFITSRVSNHAQREKGIREELFKTLKDLNTEYVDLLQFHWPVTGLYLETWQEMVKLHKEGYCKSIGVANCHQHHLEAIAEISDIVPAINQIEKHPLFTQKELIHYCQEREIVVQAYSPLARFDDRLVRLPLLKNIANKYNKSLVQVVLRWHVQNGVIPIVKSANKGRQLQNISIFDFELTAEEMKSIDGININARIRYDPDNCDFSIL